MSFYANVSSTMAHPERTLSELPRADIWLHDKRVARLYREGDFKHVLMYEPGTQLQNFVSLTMPVRAESWTWPQLHPFFQMNLPEGYQLKLLHEAFGTFLDGTDLTLLQLIGNNAIGRVAITQPDRHPHLQPEDFELANILKGDNSESVFLDLMKQHLKSAVSGVMPKFLSPPSSSNFNKGVLITSRYIVKSSSPDLPYLALNEHLTMQLAAQAGLPTAKTLLSEDALALAVERFDTDDTGRPSLGFEDFCSLVALRPNEKYDTTWERIAKALREYVPAKHQAKQLDQLMRMIVLTYVTRNADCHSKNLALIYETRTDVQLAPVYDAVTTVAYPHHQNSPPGLMLAGRKTWQPGKSLQQFAHTVCNLSTRRYRNIVEETCQAAAEIAGNVVQSIADYPNFREIGKSMLAAWSEGIEAVTANAKFEPGPADTIYSLINAQQFSPTDPAPSAKLIGRSELLGRRSSKKGSEKGVV